MKLTNSDPIIEDSLTTEELAKRLSVSTQTIRQMARDGDIPSIKLKRTWRFDWAAVKEALQPSAD